MCVPVQGLYPPYVWARQPWVAAAAQALCAREVLWRVALPLSHTRDTEGAVACLKLVPKAYQFYSACTRSVLSASPPQAQNFFLELCQVDNALFMPNNRNNASSTNNGSKTRQALFLSVRVSCRSAGCGCACSCRRGDVSASSSEPVTRCAI